MSKPHICDVNVRFADACRARIGAARETGSTLPLEGKRVQTSGDEDRQQESREQDRKDAGKPVYSIGTKSDRTNGCDEADHESGQHEEDGDRTRSHMEQVRPAGGERAIREMPDGDSDCGSEACDIENQRSDGLQWLGWFRRLRHRCLESIWQAALPGGCRRLCGRSPTLRCSSSPSTKSQSGWQEVPRYPWSEESWVAVAM